MLYLQATQGEPIGFLQEARCGDLAFFDNDEGRITHVGIMLNPQQIIHASGKVRIDRIDNAGIIQTETGMRTHKLRMVRRYFENILEQAFNPADDHHVPSEKFEGGIQHDDAEDLF